MSKENRASRPATKSELLKYADDMDEQSKKALKRADELEKESKDLREKGRTLKVHADAARRQAQKASDRSLNEGFRKLEDRLLGLSAERYSPANAGNAGGKLDRELYALEDERNDLLEEIKGIDESVEMANPGVDDSYLDYLGRQKKKALAKVKQIESKLKKLEPGWKP